MLYDAVQHFAPSNRQALKKKVFLQFIQPYHIRTWNNGYFLLQLLRFCLLVI